MHLLSGLPLPDAVTGCQHVCGRTTKLADPGGNITYTVHDDENRETRTYRGWDATTNLPTGPTEVTREDRPGSYLETLTTSATPTVSGGRPTGTEAISSIETLSRSYTNAAGQVTHTREYFSLSGVTYSTAATLGTEGIHYLQTDFAYDKQGRQARVKTPDGTIRRTIYDGLDRVVSTWIGTNDTPASGFWSPTNNTSPSNMLQTAGFEYDGGGVGDGNLTEQAAIASATVSYATSYQFDWRNRLTDQRGADKVATKYTLDNLGQSTVIETYADADTDFTIDTTELRGKAEASFDEQGRAFQTKTYEVDQSNGTIGDRLTSNRWFDHRGNLIKSSDGNGLFSKLRYDGAGRTTHSFVSFDTAEISWADADDVTGDTVIEQTQTFYDAASRAVAELSLSRYEDDTTSTGELAANAAYPSVSVNWFDRADRLTHTANYGRDDGSTRYVIDTSGNVIDADSDGIPDEAEGTPREPNTSDDYLVGKTEYDSAGRAYRQTDNLGRAREQFFDLLGRTTKSVGNFVDGTVGETETDTDQRVKFEYDSKGRLDEQIASNPKGTGNGVEQQSTKYLYESPINSSFVTSEIYPDSSDTTSSGTDQVKRTYDRLGRTVTTNDQRGVEHSYTFDSAGRAKADAVATLPSGVDGGVRRIERAYDDMSRLETLSSYDAATAGNVVNQVELAYNGWGVVSQAKQEHDGAVDANTPKVAYAYDDGATGGEAKFVRLASVTYPDGRQVHYNIPASGVGQKLARVDNIADDSSGTNKYAQYQYVGSSMIVSISHPEVTGGLNLSYGASGAYGGWDRFGRIVDQNWTDDSAATIDEIQHSYDRNSNRLTRTNGLDSALDEVYTYDGLDRLIDTNRNGANLQDWSLDALGNWSGFTDGATTQTRTNNAANEITGISGGGWIAPVYDAAGNMTSGPKPGDETTRLHFKYDAWNRLAEVKDDNAGVPGTTIASYEYDGRNYRIEKTVGADTFDVFYNEAWQVLEIRKNGDADPLEQNVWDVRYVDAPIVRFLDANTDGDCADAGDSTLYYVQDANFNVTALVDTATGDVVERYSYDPYGKATVYDASWNVRPSGSAYANELQYASYRLDPETGLYQVRNRFYHTALGMWISRDPIQADINLYRYVHNSPLNLTDPLGLADCKCPPTKKECDAAIAQIDNTIAQMVRFASDGHNHTLAEALAVSKAWATTTGHRSEELKEQPCFFQQAVEDVETSNVLRVTTGVVWFEEWVGSSLPNWIFDNTNWNTGNGDVWMRMEMWRSGMLKKRIQVLCKDAK